MISELERVLEAALRSAPPGLATHDLARGLALAAYAVFEHAAPISALVARAGAYARWPGSPQPPAPEADRDSLLPETLPTGPGKP